MEEFNLSDRIFWIETCKRKGGKRSYKTKPDFKKSESYKSVKRVKVKDIKELAKRLRDGAMSGVSAWEFTKKEKGKSLPCFVNIDLINKLFGDAFGEKDE